MASAAFTVVADVALARKFRITLQQLPSLCSRILESRSDDQPAGTIVLTHADLEAQAAANLSAAREDEAKRARRSHNSALARASKTANTTPQSGVSAARAIPGVIS